MFSDGIEIGRLLFLIIVSTLYLAYFITCTDDAKHIL